MPVVNLPDGSRINFPDGTPEQEMTAAIGQLMGGQNPAPAQAPVEGSGIAANIAAGANSRIADLAGFPAEVVNAIGALPSAAGTYVGRKLRELTGKPPMAEQPPEGMGRMSGTSADIESLMGRFGFDPRNVKAVTPAEKFAHGAGSGVVDAASAFMPATMVANTAKAGSLSQKLAETLAAQPVTQAVSSAVGEGTGEATGSPLLGLAAGLATPVGMAGVSRGVRYAGSVTGLSDPAGVANRKLFEAFQRDGIAPNDAIVRLQEWQQQGAKPEMLFDLGGENVRNLAKAAATVPGTGRQAAQQSLIERQMGQRSRVTGDIADTISPNDYSQVADELMAARAEKADPLYKAAFTANQSVDSNELNNILKTPAGRRALKDAAELMQNDRTLVGSVDPEMTAALREAVELGKADPVSGGVARGLKLRTLDYVKQSLYDAAEKAKVNGKNTAESRAIKGLYADLTKELDRLDVTAAAGPNSLKAEGGAYAQARAAYGGPSRSLDAMESGLGIFKEDSDVTAKQIASLAPGDKEFFKVGVVKALRGIADNTPDGADITRRLIGRPALRDKLKAAFDGPKEFQRFMDLIQRESSMYANARAVNPRAGSQTAPLGETLADLKIDPALSAFGHFLAGNYGSAAKNAGIAAINRMQGFRPSVSSKLVEALMNPNQDATISTLRGLRDNPVQTAGPTLNRGLAAALLMDRTRQALPDR